MPSSGIPQAMFKKMIFPRRSSFKLENLFHFVLFLVLTPLAIIGTALFMGVVSFGVALQQLLASMMKNSLLDNLMIVATFFNQSLSLATKLPFITLAAEREIKTTTSSASSDSGIESPNNSEANHEEFADPHDAWVQELGTGSYEPNFKEKSETFYLVFWYSVCNHFLM